MTNDASVRPARAALNRADSGMTGLRDVLVSMLPSPRQSLLLKACLGPKALAPAAWRDWLAEVRDPKSVFETDAAGLRGLLPFIGYCLDVNEIEVSNEFRVYLQISSVREELRSNIYRQILTDTLSALRVAGCDVIALRAAALSETIYDKPSIRHNHAIELLVDPSQIQSAVDALAQLPFKRKEQRRAWQRHSHAFMHRSGLPVVLHTRLLLLPYHQVDLNEIWHDAGPATLSGIETKVLSQVDGLVNICAHASSSPGRGNLRWVCDAALTVRRYPGMNWDRVAERAQQLRLVLPLWAMFEYLARQVHTPIPEPVLTGLSRAAARADRVSREAATVGAVLGAASPADAIRRLRGNRRAQMLFVRFFLLPSRTYMAWRYGLERRWLLPFGYLYRLMKFEALAVILLARKHSVRGREQLVAEVDR